MHPCLSKLKVGDVIHHQVSYKQLIKILLCKDIIFGNYKPGIPIIKSFDSTNNLIEHRWIYDINPVKIIKAK